MAPAGEIDYGKKALQFLRDSKIFRKVECNPLFETILKRANEWCYQYEGFNTFTPEEAIKRSHITGGAYVAACYTPKETDLEYMLPGSYHASCYMMYDDMIDDAVDLKAARYITKAIIDCLDGVSVDKVTQPFADSWVMLPFTDEQKLIYAHHLKVLYTNCYKVCEYQFRDDITPPTIEEYLLTRRFDMGMDPYTVFYYFINKQPVEISKFDDEKGVRFRYHAWKHGAMLLDLCIFFSKDKGSEGKNEQRFKNNIMNLLQRIYQIDMPTALEKLFTMMRFEEDMVLAMLEENDDEGYKIVYNGVLQCHACILDFVEMFIQHRYK